MAVRALPRAAPCKRRSGDEATTIGTVTLGYETDECYSLDGRKLSGKPTKKGLYIRNGKKTVVK